VILATGSPLFLPLHLTVPLFGPVDATTINIHGGTLVLSLLFVVEPLLATYPTSSHVVMV